MRRTRQRHRREREAAREVVRHRSRFGDLVEVADLAIALEAVGADGAARYFLRTAAALRDGIGAGGGEIAFSRRLGDPYCVFEPVDPRTGRWTCPRWLLDRGQVWLLLDDVVRVCADLPRHARWGDERRRARIARRVGAALGDGGPVVPLHSLAADQPLP